MAEVLNGHATLLTSKGNVAQVKNFLQLAASIADVSASETAAKIVSAAEKKKNDEEKELKQQRNLAKKIVSMEALLQKLYEKVGIGAVNELTMAKVRKLTLKELDTVHWTLKRKNAKGTKREEKEPAVAAALGLDIDGDDSVAANMDEEQ